MGFKDTAAALTAIVFVSLTLGFFTGGMAFYATSCLALAAIAIDLFRYLWLIRDLERNLVVSRTVSGMKLLLGSAVTVVYDLEYHGRRKIFLQCVQPAAGSLDIDGSPMAVEVTPGRKSIAFTVRPTRRGTHVLKDLRMTVETFLFRGTLTSGGDAMINAYLAIGQDCIDNGARRGQLKRLGLPGSHALRQGTGSDFSRVRNFTTGDSIRNIDWARSSGSPTLIVREFEDERTLPLFLLIDVDSSMDRGTTRTELESAVGLATVLASRVLLDNERIGLACFSRSDVTGFLPLAGGKGQMARIRTALSSLKAIEGGPFPRPGYTMLQDTEAILRMFRGTAGGADIASILDESILQFSANVRDDGFIKALMRVSLSTGMPCSIVIITNLSMGMASLMSGIRIASYYGHNVSVALAPRIWYDSAEDASPEKCMDGCREAKDMISRLRGRNIAVMELSACQKPETILYQSRVRCRPGMAGPGR